MSTELDFEVRDIPAHLLNQVKRNTKYAEISEMLAAKPGKAVFIRCDAIDAPRVQGSLYSSLKQRFKDRRISVRRSNRDGGLYVFLEDKK